MAKMQTYDPPTNNWAAKHDYDDDYRDGERVVSKYEQNLSTLEMQALEIYKKATGLQTITQEQLTQICASCNEIVANYQSGEKRLTESANYNGYVEAQNVDPNNPYLDVSDVRRRDAAYSQMREAVYGFNTVLEEDGTERLPMVDVNIPAPIQKPSEQ